MPTTAGSSSAAGKKKRRSLPKTRTGCRTCKIRRVKCGEERPHCFRCIKFGTKCDGYVSDEKAIQKALLPKAPVVPPLVRVPTTSLFTFDQEYRYFDVFCNKTAFEILPDFDEHIFPLRQVILQTCESQPAIKHAVIALGALDLAADSHRDFSRLSLNGRSKNPQEHHHNAFRQYTTAIREMRIAAESGNQDLRVTLLTCLVVMCFEAWNGDQEMAIRQIRTGFRLIQAWREEAVDARDERRFVGLEGNAQDPVEDQLVRIFKRLDVQAVSFTYENTPERKVLIQEGERALLSRMPAIFESVHEASIYEYALVRQTMRVFSERVRHHIPPPPRIAVPLHVHGRGGVKDPALVAVQQRIMADLARWKSAFEPLRQRFRETARDKVRDRDYCSAMTGLMHIHSLWVALKTICMEDEGEFDAYLDVFRDIVETAEFFLDIEAGVSRAPKFRMDSLVVIPLYMVTFKCRHREVRRRAVELLLGHPRREGVWDSVLSGKTGEWAMQVEEEFCDSEGRVPVWARIHYVALARDPEARLAVLSCRQRAGSDTDEMVTRTTTISL
ncbi:hypothetical protein LZ554_006070 [Drepanopeziza brunnea f. sp. 'monogermtubi']|nr:hypothetical protein LZ554_006070 [Drepanopeziza brunnea f. sp. 'monogermtubi']